MRPRPVYAAVLAFEAGLAIGLSHFLEPRFTGLALTALAGILAARLRAVWWVPAMAVAGIALGAAAQVRSSRGCAARLPAAELEIVARIQEPVTEGLAAARVEGDRCRGGITLRISGRTLTRAGTRARVSGRWIPTPRFGGRPDGLLVVRQLVPLPGPFTRSERLRTWLALTSARLYGSRSGLVEALLVGRRGGIDPGLNAAFSRSGLVHLLSISGFHVGLIFTAVVAGLRLAGIRRQLASVGGVLLVVVYVSFLGWPAPAARAALLAAVVAWSQWRQRRPAAGPLLAVTCLTVTLLDPWAIFDLGGWLSACALAGAMTFARWGDRAVGTHALWRMLFASIGATLATAPLTAAAFGSVALVGIALNFVAIPLAALALPAVIGSFVAAVLIPPAAGAFAAGGGLGLAGLEQLARFGSVVPAGALLSSQGPAAALPWIGVLAAAIWVMGRGNTSRRAALRAGWLVGATGVAALLPLGAFFAPHDAPGLSLHFLRVGQGDAALIRTPGGHWILIDAGPADERHDAGRDVVLPFLVQRGVRRLSAFVLSHAHLDHVGGAPAVLGEVPADLVLEPAEAVVEPHYLAMLRLASEQGSRWRPARPGDSLVVDGVRLRVLHPDTTWSRWGEDLNDDSVVLLLSYGRFDAVFAGDLGVRAESLLAGRVGSVELLKVGHHGSAGSTGAAWLHELSPRAAIVSVGVNRYGHPSPAALARLDSAGVEVWRTDREGTVTVTVSASDMTVRGRRGSRRYPLSP